MQQARSTRCVLSPVRGPTLAGPQPGSAGSKLTDVFRLGCRGPSYRDCTWVGTPRMLSSTSTRSAKPSVIAKYINGVARKAGLCVLAQACIPLEDCRQANRARNRRADSISVVICSNLEPQRMREDRFINRHIESVGCPPPRRWIETPGIML